MSSSPLNTPSSPLPASVSPDAGFRNPLSNNAGATLLAAIGGYVDTLGFVALFGLFTAHVTGNFVLIGTELVRPSGGVLLKFLAFPAFILAVAMSRLIALRCETRGHSPQRSLFVTQAVFLLAFMLAGWYGSPMPSSHAPWALTAGLLGTFAMGLQNGAGRLLLSKLTPHTVMTGNVTQLVLDLTDLAIGHGGAEEKLRVKKMLWPIIAFALGAMLGALVYMQVGFLALAPALIGVIFIAWRGVRA